MRKSLIAGAVGTVGVLVAATPALATRSFQVDLTTGDFYLASHSLAYWDTGNDESACAVTAGFTALYDGAFLGNTDAFDGGFMIRVGSTDYNDPNGLGTVSDNVLTTGAPATVAGLKVNAAARAIQTSTTLQYLVKFKNPTKDTIKRKVSVDTNLGSDTSTNILKDSSGNLLDNNSDRWLVTGDSTAAPFDDPIVTQVLKGKNAPAATTLTDPLGTGDDCMTLQYSVRVPAGQSRYLLLFAELHEPSDVGVSQAVHDVARYNKQADMKGALYGLSHKLYPKIVNWDLKK
jgi:hypothetical protein